MMNLYNQRIRKFVYHSSIIFLIIIPLNFVIGQNIESDSITEKETDIVMQKYIELFGVSDIEGNFYKNIENRFQSLFTNNAMIYNYLPGTPYYQQNITVTEYIEIIKSHYNHRIIRAGKALDYETIYSALDIEKGLYRVENKWQKNVLIFDKDSYRKVEDITINLVTTLVYDDASESFLIERIALPGIKYINLTFRVLSPNRQPKKFIPLDFSYKVNDREKLNRRRHTNHNGEVFISRVPENAILSITSPGGYALEAFQEQTAGQWKNIDIKDRFLILKKSSNDTSESKNIRFSGGFLFPLQILGVTLNNPVTNANHSFRNGYLPVKTGGYMQLSGSFRIYKSIYLLMGLGFEYLPFHLESTVPSFIYPTLLNDDGNLEINEDVIIGEVNKDTYNASILRMPLSIGLQYKTHKNRTFSGASLNALMKYTYPFEMNYMLNISDDRKTLAKFIAYHHKKDEKSNLLQNGSITQIAGEMSSSDNLALGMEAVFNFNLHKDILVLQYRASYHFHHIFSNSSANQFSIQNEVYRYFPLLENYELTYSSLYLGMGLAVSF